MLYDPKWEKPVTPVRRRGWLSRLFWPLTPEEVFSAGDFTMFLSQQPADKSYDYAKPLDCAVAQYLRARGVKDSSLLMDGHGMGRLHPQLMEVVIRHPMTFGAALNRARTLLP